LENKVFSVLKRLKQYLYLGVHSAVRGLWVGREEIRTCSLEPDTSNSNASSIRATDLSRSE